MDDSSLDKIFINRLSLEMSIGVHEHEKIKKQLILVSVEAEVKNSGSWKSDDISETVSYEEFAIIAKRLAESKHYNLVESFAEDIADKILVLSKVVSVKVRIEKPDIFNDVQSVGAEIFRRAGRQD